MNRALIRSTLRGASAAELQAMALPVAPRPASAQPQRHPVVVVGAGPVGLSLAIDLAQRGRPVLLLEAGSSLSTGSRALCFAKRTLEIWDRLGVGQRMVDKGVSWNVGRVFLQTEQVYEFNLLPEAGHERPAFINLQQYYCEAYLLERLLQFDSVQVRWGHPLAGIEARSDGATLTVQTAEGSYCLEADWVLACDGSRSSLRRLMGLETQGRVFQDRFLIADVKMKAQFPAERWFWFDPPFHPGQSVLLHRQSDDVWRIDFQLGWDADPEQEKQPERILPRVRALLGQDADFSLEWASVYTFACRRMERFVQGRVVFAGDAAHGVSPFGARGANSGVQDAENLAWKLDAVLGGRAGPALLDSYGLEREFAADENILNSTRSTDFITPKSAASRLFRDAVLGLARDHPFARRIVNSGRLSVPAVLSHSPLNTPDVDHFEASQRVGAVLTDAPLSAANGQASWLLRELGADFTALAFAPAPAWLAEIDGLKTLVIGGQLSDEAGLLARRLDARGGTVYLVRPDQHVCARWRAPTREQLAAALARAQGQWQPA
jgi:3-(3-hydroxy-phenyl)propionate hydroxylase